MPEMLKLGSVHKHKDGPFFRTETTRDKLLASYRTGLAWGLQNGDLGAYLAFHGAPTSNEVRERHTFVEKELLNHKRKETKAYHCTTKHLDVTYRIGAAVGAAYAGKLFLKLLAIISQRARVRTILILNYISCHSQVKVPSSGNQPSKICCQ